LDGTGGHHVKGNKPDWKRQIRHVVSHKWTLDLKKKNDMQVK
jgi:hypothetical protein